MHHFHILCLPLFYRGSITVDFKTKDPSGLRFLLRNFATGDMIAANLAHGYLTFIRKCGRGKAFERYTKRMNDARWHSVSYSIYSMITLLYEIIFQHLYQGHYDVKKVNNYN